MRHEEWGHEIRCCAQGLCLLSRFLKNLSLFVRQKDVLCKCFVNLFKVSCPIDARHLIYNRKTIYRIFPNQQPSSFLLVFKTSLSLQQLSIYKRCTRPLKRALLPQRPWYITFMCSSSILKLGNSNVCQKVLLHHIDELILVHRPPRLEGMCFHYLWCYWLCDFKITAITEAKPIKNAWKLWEQNSSCAAFSDGCITSKWLDIQIIFPL